MKIPGIIPAPAHLILMSREPWRLARKGRAAAALQQFHLKGRFTVKKLLAMAIVFGIIGLTTGCPSEPTKTKPAGTGSPKVDKPPSTGDAAKKADDAGKKADDAGKKADDAGKKADDASKKASDAGKKADDAGKKADDKAPPKP
jgi:uncharacterized protein DUF3359